MAGQSKVFEMLDSLGIEYSVTKHSAAFTIDDIDALGLSRYGDVCKNLFLRDAKGERHFLVVMNKDKQADIKSIQDQLSCSRLSFASEERLYKYLKLKKGEVSPLGIINDSNNAVEIVIDDELPQKNKLGFHPNDNTATVWLSFEGLKKVIEHNGNIIHYITI